MEIKNKFFSLFKCKLESKVDQEYCASARIPAFSHYQTIGAALVNCELLKYRNGFGESNLNLEFKQRVCTVSVEILESYLDDLLHVETKDHGLFIERYDSEFINHKFWLPLGFSALAIGICYLLKTGIFGHIISVAAVSVGAFLAVWAISPYNSFRRRLFFAQLLSNEITRRRGVDKKGRMLIPSHSMIDKFFDQGDLAGGVKGAARVGTRNLH